eukprot:6492073-Amphidinium_carterae.5
MEFSTELNEVSCWQIQLLELVFFTTTPLNGVAYSCKPSFKPDVVVSESKNEYRTVACSCGC